MAKYEYRYSVDGRILNSSGSLSSLTAVTAIRHAMSTRAVGVTGTIERRTVRVNVAGFDRNGSWVRHRAYVVDEGGVVRRTDRTPA